MGSKRRYHPIGREPVYDHFFDLFRVSSQILNRDTFPSSSSVFFDKQGLLNEMRRIQGDENGEFTINDQKNPAEIPLIKAKLRMIDETFTAYCKQRVNSGFAKPDKMPIEMHEMQMKLFARLDTLIEELEEVENKLKSITEVERKEDESMILCYGLRGFGKLRGGVLVMLDYQRVIQNNDGLLIIANGPYKGMLVTDYRVLINRYQSERKEAERKQLLQLQERAISENRPVPKNLPIASMRKVSVGSLPPFPKDFKKYEI